MRFFEHNFNIQEDFAALDQVANSYFNAKPQNNSNKESPRAQFASAKTPSSNKKVTNIKGFESRFVLSKKSTQWNSNYFPSPFKSDRPAPSSVPQNISPIQKKNELEENAIENFEGNTLEGEFELDLPNFNISIDNEFEKLEISGDGKAEVNANVPVHNPDTINTWIYPSILFSSFSIDNMNFSKFS